MAHTDKIKCGDSAACKDCRYIHIISRFKFLPVFTRNFLERCDWFSHKDR
jgi:hypothetical protein